MSTVRETAPEVQFLTAPRVTVIARPQFTEPTHLPVEWIGEGSDGERLAE